MEINTNKLIVQQKVEMLEAFTGIETKNKYNITNSAGTSLFHAYEESNTFLRLILKQMRPLKLKVLNLSNTLELSINKSFAFFFPTFKIEQNNVGVLAIVKKKFKFFTNEMDIFDKNNNFLFKCKATIMHPWTFNIYKTQNVVEGQEVAVIFKKWGGIGKEMFTDADNFEINFKDISDNNEKQIITGLAFAIDLSVFERR